MGRSAKIPVILLEREVSTQNILYRIVYNFPSELNFSGTSIFGLYLDIPITVCCLFLINSHSYPKIIITNTKNKENKNNIAFP